MICCMSMDVLEWSSLSSSNLLLLMLIAGSMGTDVNSAEISYEVIHSLVWRVIPFICSTKSPVFLMWWGELPTKGHRILANSLATSYLMEPLLDTMGLRGMSLL